MALLMVALAASSCAPIISSHPSDMVLIEQESHNLAPLQVTELKGRLNAFASKHGLSFGINGSARDGGVFAIEMKNQQEATSIIVTSPFKPTTFIFGLYSQLPETRLAPQRALFASAVRVATRSLEVSSLESRGHNTNQMMKVMRAKSRRHDNSQVVKVMRGSRRREIPFQEELVDVHPSLIGRRLRHEKDYLDVFQDGLAPDATSGLEHRQSLGHS